MEFRRITGLPPSAHYGAGKLLFIVFERVLPEQITKLLVRAAQRHRHQHLPSRVKEARHLGEETCLIADMVHEILGDAVSPAIVDRVIQRAQGNPFWIEELLRAEDAGQGENVPDRIVLYKGPLTRMCADMDELVDEIAITLVHELGHFHGIEEDRLHELGWG